MSAYLTAFEAEFRRIDSGLRAGGREPDAMLAYVTAERDEARLLVWREAFAMAEKPSGWERQVRDAAERDEQAQRAAKRSGGRSWLSSAFRRRSGRSRRESLVQRALGYLVRSPGARPWSSVFGLWWTRAFQRLANRS